MEEPTVDLNTQIRLIRTPTSKYPYQDQDIFQMKIVPPVPVDQLQKTDLIIRNLYLQVNGSMRLWITGKTSSVPPVLPGDVMRSRGVGQVLYSKSGKIPVGSYVYGSLNWQKYSVLPQKDVFVLPSKDNPQNVLTTLGTPGLAAWIGLHKIGNIKKGEIVVVSSAAGSVGSQAVQLAKDHGCIVCGITSSDQKCKYVKELGADTTINYKSENVEQKLKKLYPKGINVYFDNVGGQMLDAVLMNITDSSRIVLCGNISGYHQFGATEGYKLKNYPRLIIKKCVMQGYIYYDNFDNVRQGLQELIPLKAEGKIKCHVNWIDGLQQCSGALKRLLKGQTKGKTIIRVRHQGTMNSKL